MSMNTRYETRGVLAGAYARKTARQNLLTHLCDTEAGTDEAMCGRAPSLCDLGGLPVEQHYSRPTCPRCAKKWDRLVGLDGAAGIG